MKKLVLLCVAALFSISAAGSASAVEFDEIGQVDIHGFISQGYLKSDENNQFANTEDGSFEFNELGLNFSTDLSDQLRIGLQFFARDLGDVGNDEIDIDWAFADYRWQDYMGLRVGKVKVAHGLYNDVKDIDAVRTAALLPGSIYRDRMRDTFAGMKGISIYGELPGGFSYLGTYGTLDIPDDDYLANLLAGSLSKQLTSGFRLQSIISATDSIVVSNEGSTAKYGRNASVQWATPLDGLRVGASHYGMEFDMDATVTVPVGKEGILPSTLVVEFTDVSTTVGYAEYTIGDLILAGEYANTTIEVECPAVSSEKLQDLTQEGWYVSASYRINDLLELGTYYSVFYRDKDDRDGKQQLTEGIVLYDHGAWQKDLAVSARFDINESWIVKLEGHYMDGTYFLDTPSATDPEPEEEWYLGVVKATFSF